ncbi:MAG: 8-amino-7-oxononanoate synthase [Nitrospirota bacterium]
MFERELDILQEQHLIRTQVRIGSAQGPRITVDGKQVVLLCSNNYLGIAEHPALKHAACDAMERYGFGTGASRLVSGNTELHEALERRIASFKGTESAIVFNSGYTANTGVIPAVAGDGDLVLSDRLNHASIIDGCRLSRARTEVYRHRDMDHLESLLRSNRTAPRKLIVTDGVFSMDGDIAPLPDLVLLAERYDAVLMVDDAHATGVLGKQGRGTAEHFGLEDRVHIQMGTLGKALGSFGAYITGAPDVVRYLLNTCRSYLFSTSLPPAVCAASIAAFDVLEAEPWRRERLWDNRSRLAHGLASLGINIAPSATPIFPLLVGSSDRALHASQKALAQGMFAIAIRPPTIPDGSARLRVTVLATHTEEDIAQAVRILGILKEEGYFSHGRPE